MCDLFPQVILNQKCSEHVGLRLDGCIVVADVEGLCAGVWVFVKSLRQQYVRHHTAFSTFYE